MKTLKERIITVGTFPYSRALLLQVQLHTEGIECFLVEKETVQPIRTADLRVKQADVARAVQLIDIAIGTAGAEKEKSIHNMGVIRRIMVPVDFSPLSLHACRFAISLAEKFKAEVKLLHVYYNPVLDLAPYDEHYSYQVKLSDNLREIEKNARLNLIRLEEKLKAWCLNERIRDVRITASLANGEAADEITSYARKYKPAIIIMGTRGLTKGTHPIGRVVNRVLHESNVPVFALPDKSLCKIHDLKNVMYATDFDPADFTAINRLLQLLTPFPVQLHCVHVSVGVKKPWDPVKMDELKNHLNKEYIDKNVKFSLIVSDNIVYGMESYMRNNNINAIAVLSHRKGTLEKLFTQSVTRKIFSETGKPLLVFHTSH